MVTRQVYRQLASGFTLVELLIATSLLLLMLLMAGFAYQLFSQQGQRQNILFEESYQRYQTIDLVTAAVRSVSPYMVRQRDTQSFYFLGREEGFTAITDTSVFTPGSPAVFRLFREQQQDGRYQLVYEESSIKNVLLVDANQDLSDWKRVVVLQDLPAINFMYLTQPDTQSGYLEDAETGNFKINLQWLPSHDGLIARTHPHRIKISLGDFDWESNVNERSEGLMNKVASQQEAI